MVVEVETQQQVKLLAQVVVPVAVVAAMVAVLAEAEQ